MRMFRNRLRPRNPFLQRHEDLLLWVRIRQLLVETNTGFKSTQGDMIVAYMLLTVIFFAATLFLQSGEK